MDSEENSLVIGEIIFSENDINEMDVDEVVALTEYGVGKIKLDRAHCKIEVFDREGGDPHFHITGDIKSAIGIYEPKYFLHGPYTDILSKKQKTELNDWMTKNENKNWTTISDFWKSHNFETVNAELYKRKTPPDYKLLP